MVSNEHGAEITEKESVDFALIIKIIKNVFTTYSDSLTQTVKKERNINYCTQLNCFSDISSILKSLLFSWLNTLISGTTGSFEKKKHLC